MDSLASITQSAAGMVAANLARLGTALQAAGQDPSPATATGAAQSGTAADASLAVLKKLLDLQSVDGAQMARMIAGQVDLQA